MEGRRGRDWRGTPLKGEAVPARGGALWARSKRSSATPLDSTLYDHRGVPARGGGSGGDIGKRRLIASMRMIFGHEKAARGD